MQPAGEGAASVQVSARGYAHAVHVLLPAGATPADDYFDLLPGETRVVRVAAASPLDAAAISATCVNAKTAPNP